MLCILSLLPAPASAEVVSNAWTSILSIPDSGESDFPLAMTLDAQGNVYVSGNSVTTDGFYRLVTVKYDSQGNEVWSAFDHTNSLGSYYPDLESDESGKLIVTSEFDHGTLVIKYDENGNQLSEMASTNVWFWSRRIAQTSGAFSLVGLNESGGFVAERYDAGGSLLSVQETSMAYFPYRLLIDSSTNIVVGGDMSDTNSQTSIAVTKYDSTGHLLWDSTYGRPDGNCYFHNFTTDTNGNTFVIGSFQDASSNSAAILLKFDAQGNQTWVSNLGDDSDLFPYGMEVDVAGNLLIIQREFKVTKCDSNGNRIWQSQAAVTASGYWYPAYTVDRTGQVYLSEGYLNYGPPGSSALANDSLTVKFDAEGHQLWVHANSKVPGGFTGPAIIKTDDSNNIYVTGFSFDTNNNVRILTTKYTQTGIAGTPSIVHDPESVRATAFTTTTFTVSATGNGPLTYQWSYNNQPIPGMTNASLILSNLAEDAGGAYSVVVSNALGWIRSRDAILSLDIPPIVAIDPLPMWLAQGESTTLSAFAYGDPPLSFQWQQNGTNLPRATNAMGYGFYTISSLALSNVSLADQGDYRVIVSNSFGMATSAVSRVHISRQIHSQWISGLTNSFAFYPGLTAVDSLGNIYISGSDAEYYSNGDLITTKLDPTGHVLWTKRFDDRGRDDDPRGIALDRWGNVYVTGASRDTNGYPVMVTIKYDPNGNLVWAVVEEEEIGFSSDPYQIAVDDSSNIFVTGTSGYGYGNSYTTIKYSSSGERLWRTSSEIYGYLAAHFLALEHDGNVVVAGEGGIIKYDSSGTELWHTGPRYIYQLKTDTNNNVYILTSAYDLDTPGDFAVQKYDPNGQLLWTSTYDGIGNESVYSQLLCVSEDGSVYVGGSTDVKRCDYLTVKFDSNGQLLWEARFSDGIVAISQLRGLCLDHSGNAYVTGITTLGDAHYLNTVKYDPNGNQLWATRYFSEAAYVEVTDITLGNETNVFVTALTAETELPFNYTLFAYGQNDVPVPSLIVSPPQGQMAFVNSNVVLSVTAGSDPTVAYQWRHFGDIIPGATNSTLIIPDFQPADGGNYSVVLDNGFYRTVSPEARLTPYTQLFSPSLLSTNQFSFTLVGEIGRTFEIQRSSDLLTWGSVKSVFNTNGMTKFTVLSSTTNNAKAFYRAKKSH